MIIGICGHLGSGKSTVCEVAINLQRSIHNFQRIGFSDTMTRMFQAMGVPGDVIDNKARWDEPLAELEGKSLRFAYKSLGNDWGRETIGAGLWVNRTMKRCEELQARRMTPIVDNVRYPSEADAVLSRGGVIIAFQNPRVVPNLEHESERHIPDIQAQCTFAFHNGGSLTDAAHGFFKLLEYITDAKI